MRTILQRYIATSFLIPFIIALCFMLIFLMTFKILSIVSLIMNKDVSIFVVLELLFHIGINFLPMAMPIACIFASVFTMTKISSDSEYIAMRSFGLSKFDVLKPLLFMGLTVGIISFALSYSIIPNSRFEVKKIVLLLASEGLIADIKPEKFFTDIPNITVFAEKVEKHGELLSKIFIHHQGKVGEEYAIFADKGEMIKDNKNELGLASVKLKLTDGNIYRKNKAQNTDEKIIFQTYEFPLSSGNVVEVLSKKEGMSTTLELYKQMKLSLEESEKLGIARRVFYKTSIEFYSRITSPLLMLLFVFTGFILGIKNTRGRSFNSGAMSMIVLMIYYALYFGLMGLVTSGKIHGSVCVFLPMIVIFIFASRLYKKLEWSA